MILSVPFCDEVSVEVHTNDGDRPLFTKAKDVAKAFGGWVRRHPGLMTTLANRPDQPAEQRVPHRPAACAPAGVDACVPPNNCRDGNVSQGGTRVKVGGDIWLQWQQWRQRRGRGGMRQ
jgi:hypothetical protein